MTVWLKLDFALFCLYCCCFVSYCLVAWNVYVCVTRHHWTSEAQWSRCSGSQMWTMMLSLLFYVLASKYPTTTTTTMYLNQCSMLLSYCDLRDRDRKRKTDRDWEREAERQRSKMVVISLSHLLRWSRLGGNLFALAGSHWSQGVAGWRICLLLWLVVQLLSFTTCLA